MAIEAGGLATSCPSVRGWRRGDQAMHHIVVPSTGQPAAIYWAAVSVAAATCVDANTASTASIIRGRPAQQWLQSLSLPARLAKPDGRVVTTGGWPLVSTFLHGPFLWYATRAAGLVTLVLLTAAMVLGILNAGRFASRRWPRFLVQGLHRNLSLLALLFLALHVGTTVIDTYTSIGLPDAIVPFLSPYKRWWLGLGALASDLMITLAVTSLLRQRIGHRLWRVVHWAGYLCWPVAIVHGLGTGTDHSSRWVLALTFACVGAVLVSVGYRAVQAIPARRLAR